MRVLTLKLGKNMEKIKAKEGRVPIKYNLGERINSN
jgi:hypothetical protein